MLKDVLLFAIYYFIFPISCMIFIIYLRGALREIKYLQTFKGKDRKTMEIKKLLSKMRKYEALFVVFLIVFLPIWSHTTSVYTDSVMHSEYRGGLTPLGRAYGSLDPVRTQIGPTYDIEKVKEKMRVDKDLWLPEEIEKKIDLDKLTRIPGRLALYRLEERRYVITYTYLGPYPIIKSFGFYQTTDDELILLKEKILFYPLYPNDAGKVYT